jgi:hypothetical protein
MKAAYSASSSGRPSDRQKPKSHASEVVAPKRLSQISIKYPAAIAFTCTLKVPASRERHFVKPIMAAFELHNGRRLEARASRQLT